MNNRGVVLIFSFFLAGVLIGAALLLRNVLLVNSIDSFEDCKAAGYPIMESFPERCSTPDGKTFTNYAQLVGTEVTYLGTMVCLPHKFTDGPVTTECAYGLKTQDGNYHGLEDSSQVLFEIQIGSEVEVNGKVVSVGDKVYDIVDTVLIESIIEVD